MADTIILQDINYTDVDPVGDNLPTGGAKINANNSLIEAEINKTKYGIGSPEGAVTAVINTRYIRTDDSTIWIKTTDSGSTGWKKMLRSGDDNNFSVLQSYLTDLIPSDNKNLVPKKYVDDATIPHISYSVNSGLTSINKISDTSVSFTGNPTITFPIGKTYENLTLNNVTDLITNQNTVFIIEDTDISENTVSPKAILGSKVYEGYGSPTGGSDGDYYVDFSVRPLASYKKIDGTWTATQFVKIGEVTGIEDNLGTPFVYALNGFSLLERNSVINGQIYNLSHNIGSSHILIEGYLNNISGGNVGSLPNLPSNSNGYKIGDGSERYLGLQYHSVLRNIDKNTCWLMTGQNGIYMDSQGYIVGAGDAVIYVRRLF